MMTAYQDRQSAEKLILDHLPDIVTLCNRLFPQLSDAEDAAQEAVVSILHALPTYRGEGPVRHWLLKVALNSARQHRRKLAQKAHREKAMSGHEFPASDPPDPRDARAQQEALRLAIAGLPVALRGPVILHYFHRMTQVEIGRSLGCSQKTVHQRLKKGIHRLNRHMVGSASLGTVLVASLSDAAALDVASPALVDAVKTSIAGHFSSSAAGAASGAAGDVAVGETVTMTGLTTGGVVMKVMLIAGALLLLFAVLFLAVPGPGDHRPEAPPARVASGTGEVATGPGEVPGGAGHRGESAGTTDSENDAGDETKGAEETDPLNGFSLTEPGPKSLSVRVCDHEGKPIAAEVGIRIVLPAYRRLGTIETRDDGIARGSLPGPGTFIAETAVDGTWRKTTFVVASEEKFVEIEMRTPGTAVISGRVTGETGGLGEDRHGEIRLIGEVDLVVEAFPESGGTLLLSEVDESGRYRISGLAAGPHILAVRSKFHAEKVEIEEGVDLARDIKLPEGSISGRVFEKWSGKPPTKVQVAVQLAGAPGGVVQTFAKLGFRRLGDKLSPDSDGRYAFTNLPDGEYIVYSNGIGYGTSRAAASIGNGNRSINLDFPLKRGADVLLTIRDAEGNDLEKPFCMTAGFQFGFTGRVVGLNEGAQDFVAWAPDHAVGIKNAVKLTPGEPTPVDFVLPRAAVTRLRFVDPDGNPITGVRVAVPLAGHDLQVILASARRGQGLPIRESGADGIVVVAGATAGPCRVTAKKSGFALFDDEVELPKGGGEVDVELLPADTSFRMRVRITAINSGGQADLLHLRAGDVILSYGGVEISAVRDLQTAIHAAAGIQQIPLALERDGKRIVVEVAAGVLGVTLEEFEE